MIEVRGLTKRFGEHEILHGIDLAVARGEVVAIIGPSGAGKTTLLRCLNYLEEPTAGVIRIGEVTVDAADPPKRRRKAVHALRLRVSMVFQNFNLFPHRTALENVIEGPIIVKREPRASAVARATTLLAKVGLANKADEYPGRLSGGQQQRVAIARALAMEPEVILFDEPTSALDPELVSEVLEVIRGLAGEHRTMVIVTHEMSFARDIADRALFVADGTVVEQGPAARLFRAPESERVRQFLSKFLRESDLVPARAGAPVSPVPRTRRDG